MTKERGKNEDDSRRGRRKSTEEGEKAEKGIR